MWKIWTFVSILGIASAKVIPFTDCGSVGGKILSLEMSPCDDSQQPHLCILHRRSNYSVAVNFTATKDSNTAEIKVYGIVSGPSIPFLDEDACAKHSVKCPIETGTTYQYVNNIYCSNKNPKVKLNIEWKLLDDKKRPLFCFAVPSVIQD